MEQRDRAKDDMNLVLDIGSLDPNGGVLVRTTYWRPRSGDPNPEHPGEKLYILSYLPTDADDLCPCGSGKPFGACCQPLPYWRIVCPNPGMQGFSLMHRQVAHFKNISTDFVHDFLQDDERLYCVEDTPRRSFWIFWGDPALDAIYGTLCFGDFELQKSRTLVITALSDVRTEVLLELLHPLELGTPRMQLDPFQRLKKPVQKASERKRRRKS